MKKVLIFLADGTEECEALITLDMLMRAGIETKTASVMGGRGIISSHGVEINADMLAEDADLDAFDAIVLPGGLKGVENLKASAAVKNAVEKFMSEGKIVAAICAAPAILAGMGILNGKTATVHPAHECFCTGAKLTHGKSAKDGNIITGQAVGGSFEFALELIAALESKELAEKTRAGAVY